MSTETNAEVRARQREEHRVKYERYAQYLGINALKRIVPFARQDLERALALGDEHLNTLPLRRWDACHPAVFSLVGLRGGTARMEQLCGLTGGWSLSDTVCVLKHVARHHAAWQAQPEKMKDHL